MARQDRQHPVPNTSALLGAFGLVVGQRTPILPARPQPRQRQKLDEVRQLPHRRGRAVRLPAHLHRPPAVCTRHTTSAFRPLSTASISTHPSGDRRYSRRRHGDRSRAGKIIAVPAHFCTRKATSAYDPRRRSCSPAMSVPPLVDHLEAAKPVRDKRAPADDAGLHRRIMVSNKVCRLW